VSAEPRYYYVDAQNQAAGPIAMAGLLALKAAGTVTDATLVVAEGGTEWVAFSTLKPAAAPSSTPSPTISPLPVAQAATASAQSPSPSPAPSPSPSPSPSPAAEPLWASQLTQKIDQLIAAIEKLSVAMQKSRSSFGPVMAPATASLHAEKINLNATPKPGIAGQNPPSAQAVVPLPAAVPVAAPRPGVATTLSPLAVPANAQKSPLPLPALGKAPGPAPAGLPKPAAPAPAPAKGNIFSKFLKK